MVKVDRVEWITMPDAQTAVNALQSGDIDFMENLPFDLLPVLRPNKDIKIDVLNKFGFQTLGRMNFLYPPFDNVKVRRAAFMAMNQKDVLDALVGNAKYQKICGAMFGATRHWQPMSAPRRWSRAAAWRKPRSCWPRPAMTARRSRSWPPSDVTTLKAQPIVVAQQLREAGFKVDLQATDWQTVVTPPRQPEAIKEGGWNMFFTNWVAADISNPVANASVGGRGKNGGWFGWSEDAKVEELRDKFARASSPDEQKKIAAEVQKHAYEQVIYIPLGQYTIPSGWRKALTGIVDGPATPVFWNIDKKE